MTEGQNLQSPDINLVYIQFGGHTDSPEGWINYEHSPFLRMAKIPLVGPALNKFSRFDFSGDVRAGNIITGLPVESGSAAGVFCSHVIEHLTYHDSKIAFQNTYEYLAPDGIFRFVLPDLESRCKYYLDHHDSLPEPAKWLMKSTLMGRQDPRKTSFPSVLKKMLSNSSHMWMWDEKSLRRVLSEIGFRDIRRAKYGDSEDQHFARVETEYRFYWSPDKEDSEVTFGELAIECKK